MLTKGTPVARAAYVILDTDGELWGPFDTHKEAVTWARQHWPDEDPEPDVDWYVQYILPPEAGSPEPANSV